MKYKSYLDFSEIEQMSLETMQIFLSVCLMEEEGREIPEQIKENFYFKIITSRLGAFAKEVKFTDHCAIFLASICHTPADAVMWAYAIADIFYNYNDGKNTVTMSDLADRFPAGFPTEKAYEKCWDGQKIKGSNALDLPQTWTVENLRRSKEKSTYEE